jgi:hypothetical protein
MRFAARTRLAIAAAAAALAVGAAPASAISPSPTELNFDDVPTGTQLADVYNNRGIEISAVTSTGSPPQPCGGQVTAQKTLFVTCPGNLSPRVAVQFPDFQHWVGVKVGQTDVPVLMNAYIFQGGAFVDGDIQNNPVANPPRPGWRPPVAVSSGSGGARIGYVEFLHWDSSPRAMTVETIAFSPQLQPDSDIVSRPPDVVASTSATFQFAASTPGALFSCQVDSELEGPCSNPLTLTGLADGQHRIYVRVISDDYEEASAYDFFQWRVDTTAPETGLTVFQTGAPFASGSATLNPFSNESSVSFQCAVDGGGFFPCASGHVVGGLAGGAHSARARAIDGAGNVDPTPAEARWLQRLDQNEDADFDGVPDNVDNCPSDENADQGDGDRDGVGDVCERFPPPRRPRAGRDQTVRLESGEVRVFKAGEGFVPFAGAANIPIGSVVDATKGRLAVTTAASFGGTKTQSAKLSAGIFQAKQRRAKAKAAITDLRLRTPAGAARACAAGRRLPAKGVVRSLSGTSKGRFRAVGSAAVATVANATWTMSDTCGGTRVTVARGSVVVRDNGRGRTIKLRPGQSYLAKAKLFGAKIRRR